MQALRELPIPCPERISVIGFDDPDWSVVSNPALTSIRQPADEIGKGAAELLLRAIESAGDEVGMEPERVLLKASLQIRESTGTPYKVRAQVPSQALSDRHDT
jgi:DNA-binding LacI/PurR family transcriptional regulator